MIKQVLKLKFTNNSTYKRKAIEYIINQNNGCWEVISHSSDAYGYKVIGIQNKTYKIHKLVLEEKLGRKLEDKEMTLHSCDNPCCCNPDHLRCGISKDNMNDKQERNRERYLKGSELPQSTLNEKEVFDIKENLIKGKDIKRLIKQFNVNPKVIMDIRAVKTWKHIHEDLNEQLIILNSQCGRGVNHYKSSLSVEDVIMIKTLLKDKYNIQKEIAKQFNTSPKVISNIKSEKTYKEITIEK